LSTVSVTSESPASLTAPALTLEDVHKAAMHISAERAKQRRQIEEEEREKEKERARQKAAALEEKLKANEEKNIAQVRICDVLDVHVAYFTCRMRKSCNSFGSLLRQLILLPNQHCSSSMQRPNVQRLSGK
jgi:hypothetical protein